MTEKDTTKTGYEQRRVDEKGMIDYSRKVMMKMYYDRNGYDEKGMIL